MGMNGHTIQRRAAFILAALTSACATAGAPGISKERAAMAITVVNADQRELLPDEQIQQVLNRSRSAGDPVMRPRSGRWASRARYS